MSMDHEKYKNYIIKPHVIQQYDEETLDNLLSNNSLILNIHDLNESKNIIKSLFRIPENKGIIIISVGEFSNTFCKSLFEYKFTVKYCNFDMRIDYIRSMTRRNKDKIGLERTEDGLYSCSSQELAPFNPLHEKFYEDFNITLSPKLWNDRKLLESHYLSHKVVIEVRNEGNKGIMESISLGTPVIIPYNCTLYCPTVYLTECNHRFVNLFNYEEVRLAIDELKNYNNESIHNKFIETTQIEQLKFVEIMEEIDYSNLLSNNDLCK